MKKVLLSIVAFLLLASPALALSNNDSTGPEGPNAGTPTRDPHFQLQFIAADTPKLADATVSEKSIEHFYLVDGWDFGDRAAYNCAWVEFFQGQNEKFEVGFFGVTEYTGHVQIVDKFGAEAPDGQPIEGFPTLREMCWQYETAHTGPPNLTFTDDGTDHFPHMVHPGDGIQFYQDGEPLTFLDLEQPACAKLYWVPGDEAGEAWLWWDEDGPTFSHGEGEGDLGCGGGPLEPVALFKAMPQNADPDIGYCTVSAHEEQCFNTEPPPTSVELLTGASVLTCPNGSTPAVESTEPLVVRC